MAITHGHERILTGSFSRVVRAEQRGTGVSYAMKLVQATDGRGPFENELAILARLDNPHVIRLHEVSPPSYPFSVLPEHMSALITFDSALGTHIRALWILVSALRILISALIRRQTGFVAQVIRTPSRVYLVLDLATGGELYEHIVARGRFGEREAAEALGQVLDGVAYLHRRAITHRDLKPENLLYTRFLHSPPGHRPHQPRLLSCRKPGMRESRLLITDFGLAFQQRQPDERMTETCGTPEYIAPEVALPSLPPSPSTVGLG